MSSLPPNLKQRRQTSRESVRYYTNSYTSEVGHIDYELDEQNELVDTTGHRNGHKFTHKLQCGCDWDPYADK
jgi:hypothetical protein